MSSSEKEPPEVRLSTLKFANWQNPPDNDPDAPEADAPQMDAQKPQPKPTNVPRNIYPNQHPSSFTRPVATERMAADQPGEELGDEATIWKLYLEEAEEHDQELVKARHASLDMLLIFAALFSAILSAFLVESKNLLQQDPADASVALLLLIAQSQQRMELGLPPPESSPPVGPPPFTPTASARWINGIWFTSLVLALSAALAAMLGKEWLTAYLTTRPRPAYSHAIDRQSRLDGLERWWALHIIAFLPSLLHSSLLLFAVGLVIYLWTLDTIVAGVIAGLVGATSLFYVVTNVQGAVYEYCPYVTQISWYIRSVGAAYLARPRKDEDPHSSCTSLKDIQALLWLANNARDPVVVECSFQALAGLHLPDRTSQPPTTSTDKSISKSPCHTSDDMLMQLDRRTTLISLFDAVCRRFKKLMRNPGELSAAGGANAAVRYVSAITELASYLERCYAGRLVNTRVEAFRVKRDRSNEQTDGTANGDPSNILPGSFATHALNILEHLWSEESPAVTTDVFACFVASELTLLCVASSTSVTLKPDLLPAGPDAIFVNAPTTLNHSGHVIDVVSASPGSSMDPKLANLLTRYSQTMARALTLFRVHATNQAPMGNSTLNRLLDAMSTAVKCPVLNSRVSVGVHYPQPKLVVPLLNLAEYGFDTTDLSLGPLHSLIRLMSISSQAQSELVLQTRSAAVHAFSELAPLLLGQQLPLDRGQLTLEFDLDTWTNTRLIDLQRVKYAATRQMLLTLRYLGPRLLVHKAIEKLCSAALSLVAQYLEEDIFSGEGASLALRTHSEDIVPILEFAGASDSNVQALSGQTVCHLLNLALEPPTQGVYEVNLCDTLLPPSCFIPLLRMAGHPNINRGAYREIVYALPRRMRPRDSYFQQQNITQNHIPSIEYLRPFTQTGLGFSTLVSAHARVAPRARDYESWVDIIILMTYFAAGRDPELEVVPVELCKAAVPGFLDGVSIVIKHCSGVANRNQPLLDFSQDVVNLLRAALSDPESHALIVEHLTSGELCSALRAIGESNDAQRILDQLDELKNYLKHANQGEKLPSTDT